MMLRELSLAPSYDKSVDDIASQFYLPCMRASVRYDRLSGYFSSAVFSIAWTALQEFVKAGGQMRLICSPVFSGTDAAALREGYAASSDSDLAAALVSELRVLLAGPRSRKPAQALAGLIAAGIVDIRLAMLSTAAGAGDRRLFHDKVGLFTDAAGDAVGFRGSMNETYLGLARDGNLESVDVFPSWEGGRDALRVREARGRFEELWANRIPAVDVREVPEVAGQMLREAGPGDWELLVDEMLAEDAVRAAAPPGKRPLRDHQVSALASWELHGRRGLLEHATGSGKTYTAIHAIRAVLAEGGSAIVLVPGELLLRQWYEELSRELVDVSPQILRVGDKHTQWRKAELLRPWTQPVEGGAAGRIVVAMLQTAATDSFRARIVVHERTMVVADEAHRLGSRSARQVLEFDAPWRLGLSATPQRAGDPDGTSAVLDYFGGVLQPPYTLADAIRDRVLTPYNYVPHDVALTAVEQGAYEDLTRQMRRFVGRRRDGLENLVNDERLRKLAIARSRVLKRAAGKTPLAVRVLREHFQLGQRWLVYCDSLPQMRAVRMALREAGFDSLEYHSKMVGDRQATLAELDINGGILVSVRCLDEGVDLPAVSHALVLASSRNPREFIQRRGRILRRYPGKSLSYLHDAVVVPSPESDRPRGGGDRLLAGELYRVWEFARGAANPQALTQVERLCIRYGVPLDGGPVGAAGIELNDVALDDSDNDEDEDG